MAVTGFIGLMGITALIGLIVRAGKVPDTTSSSLNGVIMASLAALPSLLAKLTSTPAQPSGSASDPTSTVVVNESKDPVPTVTTDPAPEETKKDG